MGRRKTTDLGHLALDEEDVGFGPVLEASVAIAKQPVTARPTFADTLPIDQIVDDSPAQTRKAFDPETSTDDAELVASVARDGVVVPVLLVTIGEHQYRLAAGHRRVAACRHAVRPTIRALIFPEGTSQQQLDEFTFLENFHRKELSPLETARQIERMQEAYDWTQEEAASALSISQAQVSQLLALLKADSGLQELVNDDRVGLHTARKLMKLDPEAQQQSYDLIASGLPATDVLETAKRGELARGKGSGKKRSSSATAKRKKGSQADSAMKSLLELLLGTEGLSEMSRSIGRKAAYKALTDHDRAVVALLGHYRDGNWPAALEEYLRFTLPSRRALAMIVKQLARLQLLHEAQRNKEQSILAFELLAHSAQALATMEQSS